MFELNAWFGPGSSSCLISAWVYWEYKPSECGCVIYFVSADFGMWTYPAHKDEEADPCCGQLDVSHKGLPPVEVNCFYSSNRSQETSTINGPRYWNAWNLKENRLSEDYTLGLGCGSLLNYPSLVMQDPEICTAGRFMLTDSDKICQNPQKENKIK